MSDALRIERLHGAAVTPHLDAVAALRIAVFRDWPYLYEGSATYEADYLATYARSPRSLFVLAFDGGNIVGASTAVPLADEVAAFQQPFLGRGLALGRVFYFGESVLLPAWRGQGLGHTFFDAREARARELGFDTTAFCAVERDAHDPRRPAGHRDNDAFWRKRGYVRQDDMVCRLEWQEIDAPRPQAHALRFWLREPERV
ncbi:GNAT family N-acetyltransferase [Tahibacter sp.]|uniref:GNAT family N-acetyltransferase n=1 Tax=Tahibacter sp. TaxID=2056211 RepID=UPI0028C4E97D|nr:GNAT family N-acetyltransferase [Tahibacter sp.]